MKLSLKLYIPNKPKYCGDYKNLSITDIALKITNNIYVAMTENDIINSIVENDGKIIFWCGDERGAYASVEVIAKKVEIKKQDKTYSRIKDLTDELFNKFDWYYSGMKIVGIGGNGFDSAVNVQVIEILNGEAKQRTIGVTPDVHIHNFKCELSKK